jgi:hypothetical protein
MWLFLKHYDRTQPGKRKTASSNPSENVCEKRTKYEKGFYIKKCRFSKNSEGPAEISWVLENETKFQKVCNFGILFINVV